MVFLLTKRLLKKTAHRIPRFGAQPFGCSVRSARGTRLALLPPSFLSSSPATKGARGRGPSRKQAQGGAARRRSRGHGPARLDGTRPRATVADKVMKSGKTAGHGNGHPTSRPHGKRSAQARSWKPGRRRQPSGARERWKPEGGETPQAARCASTTARPAISQVAGDAHMTSMKSPWTATHPAIGKMAMAWTYEPYKTMN
jgi:hypothetical protein